MAKIIPQASVSLDGYITGPDNSGCSLVGQALDLDLLDELRVDLVPHILGTGVTHLVYRRSASS